MKGEASAHLSGDKSRLPLLLLLVIPKKLKPSELPSELFSVNLVAQACSLWGLVLARSKTHRLEACATCLEASACKRYFTPSMEMTWMMLSLVFTTPVTLALLPS